MLSPLFLDQVKSSGFAILENIILDAVVQDLISEFEMLSIQKSVRQKGGIFAIRNLLTISKAARELAISEIVNDLVRPILGKNFCPVRGILFDKIPTANWKVPWHQDVTIAIKERKEVEGYGPWSVKADVLHVQPPASVLERMISVRIHLDNCVATNGALRVLPGTHLAGKLSEDQIAKARSDFEEVLCEVGRGGVLLMRPLLLHASSPASAVGHRRVVHIDFAAESLLEELEWATA